MKRLSGFTSILLAFIVPTYLFPLSIRAESVQFCKFPKILPINASLSDRYSPEIEICYSGLKEDKYTIKIWLLSRSNWSCASTQFCERTYILDNSNNSQPNGKLTISDIFDVYNYTKFRWLVRMYRGNSHVAMDDVDIKGTNNWTGLSGFQENIGETNNEDIKIGNIFSSTLNAVLSSTLAASDSDIVTDNAEKLPPDNSTLSTNDTIPTTSVKPPNTQSTTSVGIGESEVPSLSERGILLGILMVLALGWKKTNNVFN